MVITGAKNFYFPKDHSDHYVGYSILQFEKGFASSGPNLFLFKFSFSYFLLFDLSS